MIGVSDDVPVGVVAGDVVVGVVVERVVDVVTDVDVVDDVVDGVVDVLGVWSVVADGGVVVLVVARRGFAACTACRA